jgi:hypothetical protein
MPVFSGVSVLLPSRSRLDHRCDCRCGKHRAGFISFRLYSILRRPEHAAIAEKLNERRISRGRIKIYSGEIARICVHYGTDRPATVY